MRRISSKKDLSRVIKRLEYRKENIRWIAKNFSTLKTEYPNKYIAVCDGRVVASGTRKKIVREKALKENPKPDCIMIKKIEPKERLLVL